MSLTRYHDGYLRQLTSYRRTVRELLHARSHIGQWRIMQVDSGTAGLIVAAGFGLLALVVAPLFTLTALLIGVAVALILRNTEKSR
jgi:hypothetical protein